MPTVLSHPAPVLALAAMLCFAHRAVSLRLLVFAAVCSALPDADVVSFLLKIPYGSPLGYRGVTHSLAFALSMGLCGAALAPILRCGRIMAFCLSFFAVASHILLDAMTNGGLGVAAFWPLDQGRYFLPWRPIRVSPIGARFPLSERGAAALLSELKWIWIPNFLAAAGFSLLPVLGKCAAGRLPTRNRERA